MKLYLECNMGAAGDMIMAALLELLPDRDLFLQRMGSLGLPAVQVDFDKVTKCGITGTKMRIRINGVEETTKDANTTGKQCYTPNNNHVHDHKKQQNHNHEHAHTDGKSHEHHSHTHYSYQDICEIIQNLDLAENVKKEALSVYKLIGEAEATVHGVPLDQIHFHEVGSLDAVVDIVGCCLLFQMLGVERIEASPVHVGSGFVRCDHGTLPVPAPATAYILKGVPIYGGKTKGELCTPTGAALLRHFVKRFGDMEPMTVTKIGYGMGTKDFEAANCVRAFLSDYTETTDTIVEINCNLDDMTPEAIGFTTELLFKNGALDVFATPIYMKKNRPATMLTCLCKPEDQHHISQLILRNTSTLGIRFQSLKREVMDYTIYKVQTPYGDIQIKSSKGYGLSKEKPEYEDVRTASLKCDVPFFQVYAAAVAAMESTKY